jgi:hypothetical protein
MSEPAVITPVDVEQANIAAYERVFRKCIGAANRVLNDNPVAEPNITRLELAKMFFERFYSDQATITQAQKNAEAMVKSMTAIMESRR